MSSRPERCSSGSSKVSFRQRSKRWRRRPTRSPRRWPGRRRCWDAGSRRAPGWTTRAGDWKLRARTQAARQRLGDAVLRAPFAGRVGLRDISIGATVQPGTALVTLDSVSPIDLRFSVPEQQLGEIGIGAAVTAGNAAFPERQFTGEVRAIDSRVNPVTRTIEIEARLPNSDGALRPGMLMQVAIAVRTIENAVVVPPIAVVVQGSSHYVFRVDEGRALRTTVEIGQREPDRLEIVSGLAAGSRVVVEGLQGVTDGQPVRIGDGQPAGVRDGDPAQPGARPGQAATPGAAP